MAALVLVDTMTSSLPAPKLFKALILDSADLVAKVAPQAIKSMEVIEGDGGTGSVRKVDFVAGIPGKYVKTKVDLLNKDELVYVETVIEGGELSHFADKLESITNEVKFEATPEGGSIVKMIDHYHTKPGAVITEEELRPGREMAVGILKALEGYALANPDA